MYDRTPEGYSESEFQEFYDKLSEDFRGKVRYFKIALEIGEGGLYHLQMFLLAKTPQRKTAIVKQFPKADIRPAMATAAVAASYPGNSEFRHSTGRLKGGVVLWMYEIGELPSQPDKIPSPTEERLGELKSKIDSGDRGIKALWQADFYLMIRYSRAIKEYIADCFGDGYNSKNPSPNYANLIRLKRYDEQEIEIKKLREDYAEACERYCEMNEKLSALCEANCLSDSMEVKNE